MEPYIQKEIHGHLSKVAILVIVLLAILIIGTWIGYVIQLNSNQNPTYTKIETLVPKVYTNVKPLTIKSSDNIDIKKSSILTRAEATVSVPLTSTERNTILKELAPKTFKQYSLTQAEIEVILKALNRQ